MAIFDSPRGIKGLKGSTPNSAILSVGHKDKARGNPVNKDRFFILSEGFEDLGVNREGMAGKRHQFDGRFRDFNELTKGDPRASTIRATIMHNLEEDFYHPSRTARQLNAGTRIPSGLPECTGNGVIAQRFAGMNGNQEVFEQIPCPGDLCRFAQRDGRGNSACKHTARMFFQLRWEDEGLTHLPRTLVRFQTRSVYTVTNIQGMLDHAKEVASGLGLQEDQYSFLGLPLTLTVIEKVKPGKKFPVVKLSIDCDVGAFFYEQSERRRFLLESPRTTALLSAGNAAMTDPADIADALAELEPGPIRTPAAFASAPATAQNGEVVDAEIVEQVPAPYEIAPDDPRGPEERILEYLTTAQEKPLPLQPQTVATILSTVQEDFDLGEIGEGAAIAEVLRRHAWDMTEAQCRAAGVDSPPRDATREQLGKIYREAKRKAKK